MEECTHEHFFAVPRVTATRRVVSLDGMWKFQFDPEENGEAAGWTAGLPAACSMPVPSSFCDIFTTKEAREYAGDFWYETDFLVPGEWKGQEIVIRFGSVTHKAKVFLNGVEICSHVGGFLPFNAVITDAVKYNEVNKLSVLANNELSETMLPCGATTKLSNGKKYAAPYFDFYNYAGIQRPVKLLCLPRESVVDYEYTIALDRADASVNYSVKTTGEGCVSVELKDAQGNVVAEACGKTGTLVVKDAKLWNVHAPYLYNVVITIWDGETLVDEYCDTQASVPSRSRARSCC